MNRFQDTLSWWNETADVRLESGLERTSVRLREQRRLFGRFLAPSRSSQETGNKNFRRPESVTLVRSMGNSPRP